MGTVMKTVFVCGVLLLSFNASAQILDTNKIDKLQQQVFALANAGKYAEAIAPAQEIYQLVEKCNGASDKATFGYRNALAELYIYGGRYTNAEMLCLQGLKIAEKTFGSNTLATATSLNNLAKAEMYLGDYAQAEPNYTRALEIRNGVSGPEAPDTGETLNDLAYLYQDMGDYEKAEPLFLRCLKINEKVFGGDHMFTLTTVNNLAFIYRDAGNYPKAESLFVRSLKGREKTLGLDHPDTATAYNNLGLFCELMGDYDRAKPLYEKSLRIWKNSAGEKSSETAIALNNLAKVCQMMGDYTNSESLYLKSCAILEEIMGPEHNDTATVLNNLGTLYYASDAKTNAFKYFERSLSIKGKILGKNHPDTLSVLGNMAQLNRDTGRTSQARDLYLETLNGMEKALGTNHTDTATMYNSYGLLLHIVGQDVEALQFARKAGIARENRLGVVLSFTSERERINFQEHQRPNDFFGTLGSGVDLAVSVLRNKGVVLDSLIEDSQMALASKDSANKRLIDQIKTAGRKLNQFLVESPQNINPEILSKQTADQISAAEHVDNLQKELAMNVTSLGQTRRALRIKTADVQSKLTTNSVILEYVRYSHYMGKGDFEPRYGVVLIGNSHSSLKDGKPGEPIWVSLGSAKGIQSNLQRYGIMMRGQERGDVNLLKTLYSQLIAPVLTRLPANVTNLIISPDAELNFLSFATLVSPQNQFLAENFNLEYVASGRDIVNGKTVSKGNSQLVAFANPAFGMAPEKILIQQTNALNLGMLSTDRRDYAGISLVPLLNTVKEADYLSTNSPTWNFKGSEFVGNDATEENIKSLHSPFILHIATHGFFLPDIIPTNQDRNLQLNDRMPVVLHNPMQRSGLALAGAQLTLDAWKRGETPDTENDGILMAQEVSMMDLQNTWLVVLSACDTGVGEARAGEGVLGLRRGFIQAGAQNLMMTLWPVSDSWTVEMMKAFYERAMKTKDAPGALASVQREFLQKLRQEKNPIIAARLAGPFVMTFQGNPINN